MEERIAAAPLGRHYGKSAYHALTYGWLLSGLARAVTGRGMRELMRMEVAAPLNTDGIHLGRPPVGAPTRVAKIIGPQLNIPNPVFNAVAPAVAALELSAAFGSMYFPGAKVLSSAIFRCWTPSSLGQRGDHRPSAGAHVRRHGQRRDDRWRALPVGGAGGLPDRPPEPAPGPQPDHPAGVPSRLPRTAHPGVLPGFGHVGLGGSFGWAIPEEGLAFSFVHNRLLTPLVATDQAGFVGTGALVRLGAAAARKRGFTPIAEFGAPTRSSRRASRRAERSSPRAGSESLSGDSKPLSDDSVALGRSPSGERDRVTAIGIDPAITGSLRKNSPAVLSGAK